MKILLKLQGTLPNHYRGPYPESGLAIDIADGATVAELADFTGIDRNRIGLVSINGLLAKAQDAIPAGAEVKFLPPLAGG